MRISDWSSDVCSSDLPRTRSLMLTLPDVGAAATAGEAPYVLDKLLYHATGLSIEEHYTDTGVASDHVFGLMPFFGYRFAPRLRDLKDRRLHLLSGQDAGPLLADRKSTRLNSSH